jgi:predicted transcriptional regulator
MIRTTVMLEEETHGRLRRLARRRGIPLARLIREALTQVVAEERSRTPSFIGAATVEGVSAREGVADDWLPVSPFRTDPPTPEERERFDRLASTQE